MMKSKFFRMVSLAIALSLVLCVCTLPTPAQATAPETSMITGTLANPGDTATYDLQIDHALYPEAVLYAFICGGTGNATIYVYREDGSRVTGILLRARLDDNREEYILAPRGACYIRSSEGTTKNYKITVETETGDVCYAMNIGTINEYAQKHGGVLNAAIMTKNVPSKANPTHSVYYNGAQTVLNEGEWFRYTADGYTYITAWVQDRDSLAFDVYDASTLERLYRADVAYRGRDPIADTTYYGYVQRGLELEAGKEYLIKVYSTVHLSTTGAQDRYFLSIGLPYITTHKMNYYTQTYNVPANTTKTFYINVSDSTIPNSARASNNTGVYFSTGKGTESIYITSCKITAPNGQTFTLNNGYYTKFEKPTPDNFLKNQNHIPIKGTWRVTVKTSKTMNMYFKIIGYCDVIMGNDGN